MHLGVSVSGHRAETQSCLRNDSKSTPSTILPVRFDRRAARLFTMTFILVRGLHLVDVCELFRMNKLSFQVSYIKRHQSRLLYRRSNPNPLIGSLLQIFTDRTAISCVASWVKLSLHRNRHISSLISVLNVIEHLVDLLLSDRWLLHFDGVDNV